MRLMYALLLVLMACNTPSREFRDVVAQRITIEGSTFDIYVRGDKAEAIRVNAQYAPRFGVIETRAAQAMAQVSGCEIRKITGDQAHAFADLRCAGTPPAPTVPAAPAAPRDLECFEVESWVSPGQGLEYTEYDCDAV